MATESFDLIVIGGGSGGSACARRAAGYGAKVCLVDMGPMRDSDGNRTAAGFGGTCVNVGCVPKKIMFFAAQQREAMVGHVATAKGFGFDVPESAGEVDWASLKTKRDAYVHKLNNSYKTNWDKAGIALKVGAASFVDAETVKVSSPTTTDQLLKALKIVVAVGGSPSGLSLQGGGGELAINSDGFFDLESLPKKVAVIGAGYIAVEMAGILHGLGSDTHLFFRGETVLRHGFDPFLTQSLMEEMSKPGHGPVLHPNSSPVSITKEAKAAAAASSSSYGGGAGVLSLTCAATTKDKAGGATTTFEGFDVVLSAIGRTPATKSLNLSAANVAVDKRGFIVVDEFENTSAKNKVFAIGDATTTGWELTPVAIAAGRRLADRLFGGEPNARIEYESIATVVFSHPPIGTIGLTEPEAVKQFGPENVRAKQTSFASMQFAFNAEDAKVTTGLKLVLAGEEERVVGLHCIGPCSDEMMQGFAVAIRMGCTRADMEASVAIHPTISEELVTFGGWGQTAGVRKKGGTKGAEQAPRPLLPPYLRGNLKAVAAAATTKAPPTTPPAATTQDPPSSFPSPDRTTELVLAFACGVAAAVTVLGLASRRSRRAN